MRQAVNCEQETIRLDKFTFYLEDGSTDRPPAATLATKWEPVSPVGATEKEMQVICGCAPKVQIRTDQNKSCMPTHAFNESSPFGKGGTW